MHITSPFSSVVCKNESQIFCLIKVIIHPYENINVTSFLNKKNNFTNQDEQKKYGGTKQKIKKTINKKQLAPPFTCLASPLPSSPQPLQSGFPFTPLFVSCAFYIL